MQYVMLILKLLPVLIDAIKAIEAAIPQGGAGAQKLAAVREIIMLADSTLESAWPTIEAVIKTLVTLFNNTGAFKK